jgi:hypothetical protein
MKNKVYHTYYNFFLQNETKMNKIFYYDLFFRSFRVSVKALGRRQKTSYNSKNYGNLQAGKFLRYLKNRNTLAIYSA